MFKKATAVVGFPFTLIDRSTAAPITTGVVTGVVTKDGGVQTTIAATPVHEGSGQWTVNISASEMDADLVGLMFTHPSAIPASFTIRTWSDQLQGVGARTVTCTITDGVDPIPAVACWVTTDAAGANLVAGTAYTTPTGEATFRMEDGNYYLWCYLSGYTFASKAFSVSGDTAVSHTGSAATSPTITKTDIANRVLVALGQPLVSNVDTDTNFRAIAIRTFYDDVLRGLLRAHPWNFAATRVQLSQVVDGGGDAVAPAFGYSYQYDLPSDCLRTLRCSEEDADYKVEGARIVTDETEFYLEYTRLVDNPDLWDRLFMQAFVSKLTATCAVPITEDKGKQEAALAIYQLQMREARTADGQEGSARQVTMTDLSEVRL